jgi:hypothetical protein
MGLTETRLLKGMGAINDVYKQKAAEKELKVKSPKPIKQIAKRSNNQKAIMAELKKLYPIFLAKNKKCAIEGPGCTKEATCIHHTEGRLPSKIMLTGLWVASCSSCNLWCETHHAEAAKKGFKKSKF